MDAWLTSHRNRGSQSFDIGAPPPGAIPLVPVPDKIPMLLVEGTYAFFPYEKDSKTAGRIYYSPSKLGSTKGLVVVCHGVSADEKETSYTYMFEHIAAPLAEAGIIVVSIKHGSGSETAAYEFLNNIEYIMKTYGDALMLAGKPLALIGHSEGGRGALRAGFEIQANKVLSKYLVKVNAIVAIAPSSVSANSPGCSNSVLVIQGTHDTDQPIGGASVNVYKEASVPHKFLLWMFGCNHQSYVFHSSSSFENDPATYIDENKDAGSRVMPKTQRAAVQQYVAMFILWRFDSLQYLKYEGLFKGYSVVDWNFAALVHGAQVAQELASKLKVFPRYDDQRGWQPLWGKLTPTIKFLGFSKTLGRGVLSSLNTSLIPNKGDQGWILEWDTVTPGLPVAVITCDPLVMAQLPAFIEFQAIQIVRSIQNNQQGIPCLGKAQVEFNGKKSIEVAFQIEPSLMMDTKFVFVVDPPTLSRSVLSTVRISMGDFNIVSATDRMAITALRLRFGWPESPRGKVAIADFRVQ